MNVRTCEKLSEGCTSTCSMGQDHFQDVKDVFNCGDLIVYPTETLYALGTNPFDEKALNRIFEVKKRPGNMPISIAVSDIQMMESLAEVNILAQKIYEHFLPGPITLLMKKKAKLHALLTAGSDKIGIRVPDHPVAKRIIDIVGPITATSANLHGHPEPKNLKTAVEQLNGEVALYFDCGQSEFQGASTVVDVSNSSIKIIRKGVIPYEEILRISRK
ncbi:MAG: threonylcarbamoyl-AMP synthase [Methanomassiliicoccales archaeon]|nr:MAG: threonylcarbamoyl-AMP synthase [Methanomassiliicoccales archaeon]